MKFGALAIRTLSKPVLPAAPKNPVPSLFSARFDPAGINGCPLARSDVLAPSVLVSIEPKICP